MLNAKKANEKRMEAIRKGLEEKFDPKMTEAIEKGQSEIMMSLTEDEIRILHVEGGFEIEPVRGVTGMAYIRIPKDVKNS